MLTLVRDGYVVTPRFANSQMIADAPCTVTLKEIIRESDKEPRSDCGLQTRHDCNIVRAHRYLFLRAAQGPFKNSGSSLCRGPTGWISPRSHHPDMGPEPVHWIAQQENEADPSGQRSHGPKALLREKPVGRSEVANDRFHTAPPVQISDVGVRVFAFCKNIKPFRSVHELR